MAGDGKAEVEVEVEWTVELTETYKQKMSWDEFAAMFDGDPPTPGQWRNGTVSRADIDAEQLAGSETGEERCAASVEARYISGVTVSGELPRPARPA